MICVYRPHFAEVTSETLAGYQMVLQGANAVSQPATETYKKTIAVTPM